MKKTKITEFQQITPGVPPKVLLTGNGMTLPFKGAQTIEALLKDEWGKHHTEPYPDYLKEMPFPLRAVVSTRDDVPSCMKVLADCFVKAAQEPEQTTLIQNVIDTGFDVIMTTNYSLEFEAEQYDILRLENHIITIVMHMNRIMLRSNMAFFNVRSCRMPIGRYYGTFMGQL